MDRVEFIFNLFAVYAGDRRASHEIIEEYDRLKENYERIYNENCKLREEHNITDIKLLDENNRLKNIIDELEKWIEEHKQYQLISERYIVWEDKLVNKLKELKENNK